MSNELDASKLISMSLDRELTVDELSQLEAIRLANPQVKVIKRTLESVRLIATSPAKFDSNAVRGHAEMPSEARTRIQNAIGELIGKEHADSSSSESSELAVASKQLRDVAFASVLVGSGRVTEGELLAAVTDWTAYGSQSLADHLTESGLLKSEETVALETIAENALTDTVNVGDTSKRASDSGSRSVMQDAESVSGIASILGLGNIAGDPIEKESRRVGAEYSLIRKIGQGGLGSVWLARDERLHRNVAVKEIATKGAASDSTIKRFQREARVTGQLEHPNIVSVYQYGEDEASGKLFYAMRFVGKKTLREAIEEYHQRRVDGHDTAADLNRLLSAFQTVCQAVAFAHSRGVIHRDLKPENVALDAFGQVIVIDWGLAKVFGEPEFVDSAFSLNTALEDVGHTVMGQVLGTPHYMSPEQASGRIDDVDERTDVYGLGAILFTILTGKAPHDHSAGADSRPTKIDELLTQILKDPSPSPKEVQPSVSHELSAICERAMAKRKYGRYESAMDLAEAVQGWAAGIEKRTRLYGEMKSQIRELEVRLTASGDDIVRNARFVSGLPPIQGIVDAKMDRDDCESVDVWQGRLQTIFDGLLRTSRNILSISFLTLNDGSAKELVRVERHANDMSFVRVMPSGRLAAWDASELLSSIELMEPGDTNFSIREPPRQSSRRTRNKRLITVLPIFDRITSELFGFIAIETDVRQMIQSAVEFSQKSTASVLIVDTTGTVWYDDTAGLASRTLEDSRLTDVIPELRDILDGKRQSVDDERSIMARTVTLGDFAENGSLIVVVRLVSHK